MVFHRAKAMLDILTTLTVAAAATMVLVRMYQQPGATPPIETVKGLSLPAGATMNARGSGSLVLVEFADYECSFCARHERTTAINLRKKFNGRLQEVFVHFPLGKHVRAQKAAEAAECAAAQGRFWEMSKQLFEEPQNLEEPALAEHAKRLGLDTARFAQCLDNSTTSAKVEADAAFGRRFGVEATPAFFIGRRQPDATVTLTTRLNGALPFERFDEVITGLLADF